MAQVLVNAPSHRAAEDAVEAELIGRGVKYDAVRAWAVEEAQSNWTVALVVTLNVNGVPLKNHTYRVEVTRQAFTFTAVNQ